MEAPLYQRTALAHVLLTSMEMCVMFIALESARMEVHSYQRAAVACVQSTTLERSVHVKVTHHVTDRGSVLLCVHACDMQKV